MRVKNSFICNILLSTLDIFLSPNSNIKGVCEMCLGDDAQQDHSVERQKRRKVGVTLRDKHHCYLCVWKHVALASSEALDELKTQEKCQSKRTAFCPASEKHLCQLCLTKKTTSECQQVSSGMNFGCLQQHSYRKSSCEMH